MTKILEIGVKFTVAVKFETGAILHGLEKATKFLVCR
jgi:hypothetical protein